MAKILKVAGAKGGAKKNKATQEADEDQDEDELEPQLTELTGLVARLQVRMTSDKPQKAPAFNVVGVLEGSDKKLKDEYVVIGCHLDHLGIRYGVIYHGADDDGSGSAGLMAISQAFARNQVRPKRSVMFLAFCGEENGLRGSGYFANRCYKEGKPIKLSQIVAELQIDMIGRNESTRRESADENLNTLHLIGTEKLSGDLHELCVRLNDEHARFELEWDQESVFRRSDHWSFAKYGVPIAFFFTGFHPQYHQPEDTVEKINFPKLARVAAYVYDIGFELAQAKKRPMVDAQRWRRLRAQQRRARLPKDPAAPMRPEKDKKN